MATKANIQKPQGADYISLGDNAITTNAEVLETLWEDHSFLAARAYKVIPYEEFPGTDISQWYGFDKEGIYRVPSQQILDTLTGYPPGAGPGTVSVIAIGSIASRVEWVEMGDLGRTWVGTVSSSDAYRDDWHLVQTTKRLATSLTVGRANDVRTPADVGHALPLTLGAQAHRWRLHFRNTNDRTTNTIAGALTMTGVYVGEMQRDAAGAASGETVPGTLHQVTGVISTPDTGNELVTPWVDGYPLSSHTDYVVRYGITADAAQQINYLEGGGWSLEGGSSAITSAAPTMTLSAHSPLDVWLEVEVDASVPCFGYFGDSLTAGQEATLSVYDSWPARHARAHGAIPTFFAHAGARMSEWTEPIHIKFRKYSLPSYQITKPDVLYWAMGSNDLFAEDKSVQDMLDAMAVTFPLITSFSSRNVVMLTVLPRHDPEDPQEPVRREWNEHIKRNPPHGTLMVLDAAAALTAPSGDQLAEGWSATPTNIHLSSAGYARFAAQMTAGAEQPAPDLSGLEARLAALEYDPGERDITGDVPEVVSGQLIIGRTGRAVFLDFRELVVTPQETPWANLGDVLPAGYRPRQSWQYMGLSPNNSSGADGPVRVGAGGDLLIYGAGGGEVMRGTVSYLTDESPATLEPGVPA